TDEHNQPLPFANVYVRNTTNGTTANEQGYYQFKLPTGTHEVVFQYIGYKAQQATLTIGEGNLEYNVQLKTEAYALKEVVVKAGANDPAYAVITATMIRRKYHLRETEAYRCRVYMKNLQRLTEVPNKIMGLLKVNDMKPGI